jgi:hypothetical protein
LRPVQAGSLEIGPHEAGILEAGGREVDPRKVGSRKFGSSEIRGDLGMVDSPVGPGVDACAKLVKVVLVRGSTNFWVLSESRVPIVGGTLISGHLDLAFQICFYP